MSYSSTHLSHYRETILSSWIRNAYLRSRLRNISHRVEQLINKLDKSSSKAQ